jgi:hypothetical protein
VSIPRRHAPACPGCTHGFRWFHSTSASKCPRTETGETGGIGDALHISPFDNEFQQKQHIALHASSRLAADEVIALVDVMDITRREKRTGKDGKRGREYFRILGMGKDSRPLFLPVRSRHLACKHGTDEGEPDGRSHRLLVAAIKDHSRVGA